MSTSYMSSDRMDIRFRLSTRSYLEDVVCVWINPNSADEYKAYFEQLFPTMKTFGTCEQFIDTNNDDMVFLILSGSVNEKSIEKICNLSEVYRIYVFNQTISYGEVLLKRSTKFKGVFTEPKTICEQIQQDITECENDNDAFNCTSSDFQLTSTNTSINKQEPSFMYAQLCKEVIINVEYSEEDQQEMIDYLRNKYVDNKTVMKNIEKFQSEKETDFILWYTKDTIFYGLLNKALRIQNIDKLLAMRVFIKNLHQQIVELHQNVQLTGELKLYRGQSMLKKQYEQMSNNIRGLLSFNSFLSTTKSRYLAEVFAESMSDRYTRVLFEITIDPTFQSSVAYADISEFSNFGHAEEEYLFTMGSVFRIEKILSDDTNLHYVQLSLTSENDRQLTNLTEYIRKEYITNPPVLSDLGYVMHQKGSPLKAKQICEKVLRTEKRPLVQAYIYNKLGLYTRYLGDLSRSLGYYQQSITKFQQCGVNDGRDIGRILNNIGRIYKEQKNYQVALDYYMDAISNISRESVVHQELLAMVHNNIGTLYCEQRNLSQSLMHHVKSLGLRRQCLATIHPDMAQSFNNIGLVIHMRGDNQTALFFYLLSIEIKKRSMCPENASFAKTLNNISQICIQQNKIDQAIQYLKEAMKIAEKSLGYNHEDTHIYRTRLSLLTLKR